MAESVKASEDKPVAADIIGGEAYQRVKLTHGADSSATDVSSVSPMPVVDAAVKALLEGGLTVSDPEAQAALEGILAALAATIKVGDGSGALTVDGTVVLGAGTAAFGKLAANSGVDIGDVDVTSLTGGTVAHDGADGATNPIKVGGRARTELAAAVSQNDRADFMTDKFGRQLGTVAPLDQRVSNTLNRINTEAGQILAAVASTAYVVTAISVINAHASVGTKVEILDGASVKWKGYAGPLGGGFGINDPNGLFVGSANTKLEGKCVTTGADVDITVSAFKVPA